MNTKGIKVTVSPTSEKEMEKLTNYLKRFEFKFKVRGDKAQVIKAPTLIKLEQDYAKANNGERFRVTKEEMASGKSRETLLKIRITKNNKQAAKSAE